MNLTPEEALDVVYGVLGTLAKKSKPEYVWSVVHHEYGTWLHLDVLDLNKQPTKPARKYTRKERYRYCAIISLPVSEVDLGNNPLHFELGRCKVCTENWRSIYGYGSEDDLDTIDDLPSYKRKEQM